MTPTYSRAGPARQFLATRLARLHDRLAAFAGRVRDGIAQAVGEAAAEAVQVAVRAALAAAANDAAEPPAASPRWNQFDDEADEPRTGRAARRTDRRPAWADDAHDLDDDYPNAPATVAEPPADARPGRLRLAAAAALQAAGYWLRARSGGAAVVTALGVAAASAAAAYAAGPGLLLGAAAAGTALSALAAADGSRAWAARLARLIAP